MNRKYLCQSIMMAVLSSSGPAQALNVQFDYRYDSGFFADSERRAVLDYTASLFSVLGDHLFPITAEGNNHWDVYFNNPSNISTWATVNDLSVASDTVTVFVGGSAMGSGVLGYGTTGIIGEVSGTDSFVDSVYTRGQVNTSGDSATDYGVWGGSISFNADADWYWGFSVEGLDNNHHDFLTTAVHEVAHVLGYGTADSWFNFIQDDLFYGEASMAVYGAPVPVDAAHWGEGVTGDLNGSGQETLMDPSTPAGVRQLLTDLDYAGLADIGWRVDGEKPPSPSPVPIPAAMWFFSSALVLLFGSKCKFSVFKF